MNWPDPATKRGRIDYLMLLFILILGAAMVLHMTNHDPAEAGRDSIRESATAILTLLMRELAPTRTK